MASRTCSYRTDASLVPNRALVQIEKGGPGTTYIEQSQKIALGEPGYDALPHQHQLALTGVAAAADDGLRVTGRDVVVRRADADIVRGTSHMEVLGDLLFVEEAVVAARTQAIRRRELRRDSFCRRQLPQIQVRSCRR